MCKIRKALFSVLKHEFFFSFKEHFSKHLIYKTITKAQMNKVNIVKSK